MSKTKPHTFPEAKSFGAVDAIMFCAREKILKLYNQVDAHIDAKYYSEKVQLWFAEEAIKREWVACLPVHDVDKPTKFAGCILFNGRIGKLDTENHKVLIAQDLLVTVGDESEES